MKQLESDQLNLGAIKMKELTIAMLFIAAAHLYCVPASHDIQAENPLPVVKVEVEVEEEVKSVRVIEMQLADWCSPCRKFKAAGIVAELEAAGWTVKYVSNIGKKYPSFRVVIDDKAMSWTGYSSKNSFYRTLKSKMKQLGHVTWQSPR
jgi:thiol-disulfide isomerase/thioredoxin